MPASKHEQLQDAQWPNGTIFTVGHSTLSIERFIALLRTYGIERLVDIRTVRRSRRNPQFEEAALAQSMKEAGIGYMALPALGGLRHPSKASVNTGWRNEGFRGFADYMQTPAFAAAVDTLIEMGRTERTAIMCAEAVPWRCHRSLIADALEVRGIPVIEILSETQAREHKLTPFARVAGTTITYPPDQPNLI